MILWLASYPKSGNTLLRSILSTYFFSKDGKFRFDDLYKIQQFPTLENFSKLSIDTSNDNEIFKNFINAQNLINKDEKNFKFIKTHSSFCKINGCNFTDNKNTLGVIYIVRDPRNLVTSFAHHFNLKINDATNFIFDQSRFLVKTPTVCKTFIGSWNFHYNSWKQFKMNKNYLLIKYEDLIHKKKETLINIFKFLDTLVIKDFKIDFDKLNNAIKSTEFYKMKNLEKKEIFHESMIDPKNGKRKAFFNLGPENNWKKILDKKYILKIENHFQSEMKELGYL